MESIMNLQSFNQIAEVELIYKTKIKASERPQIKTSKDAADLLKHLWDETKLILLNNSKFYFLTEPTKCWEFLKYHLEE